jgi:membrane protein YdbS with pleckstrin-like domain
VQPLPISVRRIWRIAGLAAGATIFLALGAADFLNDRYGEQTVPGPLFAIPAVLGLMVGALGWWLGTARWRSWGYEITEDWIAAEWGILKRQVATVPRNRVQTVTTVDGPIDRALNLSSLNVHTAGLASPNLHIPHLEDVTVAYLRAELGQGRTGDGVSN